MSADWGCAPAVGGVSAVPAVQDTLRQLQRAVHGTLWWRGGAATGICHCWYLPPPLPGCWPPLILPIDSSTQRLSKVHAIVSEMVL